MASELCRVGGDRRGLANICQEPQKRGGSSRRFLQLLQKDPRTKSGRRLAMSLPPVTFGLSGPLALAIALVLTGCGHTLVFAEQTGFNLSIIAKSSEATPLNVNIGLDRTVASLVPPIHEN